MSKQSSSGNGGNKGTSSAPKPQIITKINTVSVKGGKQSAPPPPPTAEKGRK